MDKLTSMSVFVRVAEAGSFAAVAEEFALSTTMVANHVRALEHELNERLIERTTRRHRLTEVGAAYLERCRDVLASVAAADRVGEAMRALPQGQLLVSAPASYGTHRLVPLIGAYMRAYPRVSVELMLNDRVVDLAEEGFDVAIRSGPMKDDGLVARPLRRSRMVAAASPAYLEQAGTPAHPAELGRHNCLAFTTWGPGHSWRFSRAGETVLVPVQGSMTCNSGQALLVAALAGIGVIVQSDDLLEPVIEAGELVRLLPDWSLPTRQVHVVRRHEPRPSAKLRSFVDFIVAHLGSADTSAS
jgi:DNA-binding transcriptional LysR family regulator